MYGIVTLQFDRMKKSRLTEIGSSNLRTKGVPDTCKLPTPPKKPSSITLDGDMQLWIHHMCWARVPTLPEVDAKKSWRSLMMGVTDNKRSARAFSNFSGSGTNHDAVNNSNIHAEWIKIEQILTGGAWINILGEDNRRVIKNQDCWIIEAIDPKSDYRAYSFSTHPWLFFFPTISVRLLLLDSKGKWNKKFIENVSEPFGQYSGNTIMPILATPGNNVAYIPKNRVTISDTPKSPFVRSETPGYVTPLYANPYTI